MIRVTVLVVAAILLLGRPAPSEAQIYRWVDDQGVPHFSDGIDSVPEKYRRTAVPLGLRNAPPASSAPAGAPGAPGTGPRAAAGTGGTQIKFTPGSPIVVEALINGSTPTRLILDTGADRTVINPRVLAAAGASLTQGPGGQIRGATGTAPVRGAQVESIAVGAAKVGRLMVISHDVEQPGVDGLLGRDFLEQFKVSIDSKEGIATLGPK
jgi:hypothetical protein